MQKEIESLFKLASQLEYDDICGMTKVEKMQGPGFFPGCHGIHNFDSQHNDKSVMILGQDFDTKANHEKLTEWGEVGSNTTWRNLVVLLTDIHIDVNHCFFTNAYMGLRKNDTKNTGRSPATKSSEFVKQCIKLFKKQLVVIKPEIVLVLGTEPAKFLAKVFPEFEDWQHIETLKSIFEKRKNTYYDYIFDGIKIRFLLVIHPSLNNTNRARIFGKDNTIKEAELLRTKLEEFYNRHSIPII